MSWRVRNSLGRTFRFVSDWRESPSIVVARKLGELGAKLSYCDPYVAADADLGIDAKPVEFGQAALSEADLVVVLVDREEFVPEEIAEHSQLVLDAKAIVRGHDMTGDIL